MEEKQVKLFAHLLSLVIIVSLFFIGVNLTGKVIDTGTVNITIVSAAAINLTTDSVNFGSGAVNQSATVAYLNTEGGMIDGNWTVVTNGFLLENIGNVNVTINISSSQAAATFIGGTSPSFQYKISNNETGSCTNIGATIYTELTTSMLPGCTSLDFVDASDTLEIDFNLTVPYDSNTGARSATITVNATVA